MITILIAGNNIQDNERIAGSIIGGTDLTTCVICTRSAAEALQIAVGGQNKVCSVVTTEETFEIRRKNLNEII